MLFTKSRRIASLLQPQFDARTVDLHFDFIDQRLLVDANDGRDILDFDGGGSEVIDTSRSLTAAGVGTVVYDNVEFVETSTSGVRILDNDDYGYSQVTGSGQGFLRSRTEGYLGDERTAETIGVTGSENIARWTFAGVTPGWYRVAVTWLAGANRASNAQFEVLDGDARRRLHEGTRGFGSRHDEQAEDGCGDERCFISEADRVPELSVSLGIAERGVKGFGQPLEVSLHEPRSARVGGSGFSEMNILLTHTM
mgnify:CR=1 FL=1